MQNIVFYVAANEPLGTVKDYANAKTVPAPTMVLGASCCLRMRLFANADGMDAYPLTELANIVSWQWQMDTDFTSETDRKIEADNSEITASSVTAEIDGEEYAFTEICIPISNMLTEELVAMMDGKESATISGELCGYDNTAALVFVLQVKGFTVRGRISDPGTATDLPIEYLTATQIRALIAGIMPTFQYSADGSTGWHTAYTSGDHFQRMSVNDGSQWSAAYPIGRSGVIVDNVNYSFTTTAGQAAAITFTKSALGIAYDSEPQLSLWSVVVVDTIGSAHSGGDYPPDPITEIVEKTQINTASYTAVWSSDSLTITYYTTWPAGNWIIKMS